MSAVLWVASILLVTSLIILFVGIFVTTVIGAVSSIIEHDHADAFVYVIFLALASVTLRYLNGEWMRLINVAAWW